MIKRSILIFIFFTSFSVIILGYVFFAPPADPVKGPFLSFVDTEATNRYKLIRPVIGDYVLNRGEIIIIGNSRTYSGIRLSEIKKETGYTCALIATGAPNGGQILTYVQKLSSLKPKKLIITLDPLFIYMKQVVAQPQDNIELNKKIINWTLNWMFFRRIIDATLNMCCDRVRCRFVPRLTVNNGFEKNNQTVDYFNPFTFESFNYRATRNPNESDEDYLKWLNRDKTTRKQKLSILQKYMAELISGGWEIICIRLPISGSIKRLEEQNFDCSAFKTLCDNLKIIFFDYSEENYNTYDGSHLDAYEAERFSRRLAMDLQTKINWEKKVVFKSPR